MSYEEIKHSQISLMQLAEEWTDARLSDTLDYRAVSILTSSRQVNFCYSSYAWATELITGVYHLDISFSCWFQVIRILFCVFWSSRVFTDEGVDGVGDKVLGDITKGDIQKLLKDIWNMLLRPACCSDETFLVKSKTSHLGITPFK
jgi:hypothetical protein